MSEGRKEKGLARYGLIPVEPLARVAEVYGVGAQKYDDRNWENGYLWSLSYDAMQRHLNKWWGGESIDPDGEQHHLASVVFHAMAMMEWERTHPEFDDRPRKVDLVGGVKWCNVCGTQVKSGGVCDCNRYPYSD